MFFGTKSSPLYFFNEGSDPNVYFIMGKGWLNGYIPYKDLFDHKGPLLYVIFGIGYLISNDSYLGIYILQSISFSFILFFIYKSASLFVNIHYAYIAALLFSIIFFSTGSLGASADEFNLLFTSIGLYLILKHFTDDNNPRNLFYLFIQGILIGCVALIKFNIIILWFFPLLAIIIEKYRTRNIRLALQYILAIISGILIITLPFIAYFYFVGALGDFWESYIIFNFIYSSVGTKIDPFFIIVKDEFTTNPIIMSIIIGGVVYFTFTDKIRSNILKSSIPLMFIATYYIIFKNTYYAYYIIGICIISVLGLIALLSIIEKKQYKQNYTHILIILVGVILINLFLKRNFIKQRNSYNHQIEFVNYMKENSKGKEPELLTITLDEGYYLLTNSFPVSKYFYMPAIKYEVYPKIIDSNIKLLKSDKAPLYITDYRYVDMTKSSAGYGSRYKEIINLRYEVAKVYTDYGKWPALQYILYKRID
ncbi:dolichyl-phosphate-mannose-protein mannosyltransferase [Dysgonomonas alginatilytica]|uniref:Dolichyl-phosphate-mannose-protein mannosyltransferase n=2 Tax=Dysgonomonas alginatilytica TaxID=1605892 RepID=A0A2V3Q0N6_9BACT|nr:dolichyl-phosphate-mannose-protein mannosyltransferase [Dysgonomonas alginatilytica]